MPAHRSPMPAGWARASNRPSPAPAPNSTAAAASNICSTFVSVISPTISVLTAGTLLFFAFALKRSDAGLF
jgi:hypothetical protein